MDVVWKSPVSGSFKDGEKGGEGVNVCLCACGQACVMQACQEKHRRHPQHGRSPSNFQPPDKLLTSILHSKLVTGEGKQVMNAAFFNY